MNKLAFLLLLSSNAVFAKLPAGLEIVPKGVSNLMESSAQKIYEGKATDLVSDNMESLKDKNLYVMPLTTFLDIRDNLKEYGKVHSYKDADYAIVEVTDTNLKEFAEFAHAQSHACGAILALDEDSSISSFSTQSVPVISTKDKLKSVISMQNEVRSSNIRKEIKALEDLGTRFHKSKTGQETPRILATKYKALIPSGRDDVSVNLVDVRRSPQDNLVVRIEGSEKPDEVIILGSHIDSIVGGRGNNNAPGGDDDASGTAINLEIFRILMENGIRPKRTLEIHGYAAEEIGLVGSAQLASEYRKNDVNVKAMVQFDLALYTRRGSLEKVYFVSNGTDQDLNNELINLTNTYLDVKPVTQRLTAGTSDHQSWMRKGFPASMPTENPQDYNRKIHTTGDRLDSLHKNAIEFAAIYARLGISYVVHFGGI